jgi:hypothetical protein
MTPEDTQRHKMQAVPFRNEQYAWESQGRYRKNKWQDSAEHHEKHRQFGPEEVKHQALSLIVLGQVLYEEY